MSATNHTTNYELPIFVGTDKPAWLVDWNGAMTAIDTAIHTAEGKADQAGTDIGGIESSISTINSTLTSINSAVSQLRIDTNANTGNINTITSLIGNGEPTTTDKTIIGAINEINSDVSKFRMTGYGASTLAMSAGQTGTITTPALRKALNADGSIGKIYGTFIIDNYSFTVGATGKADIIDTNIQVKAPGEDYYIFCDAPWKRNGTTLSIFYDMLIHVKADGHVSFAIDTGSATTETGERLFITCSPCLYFFTNFGD